MSEQHSLMGGKLHLYKRPGSTSWQCSTYLEGRNHRVSSKEESLAHAKDFAEDWYLELRGKLRAGELRKPGVTFRKAAQAFLHEYETLMEGQRSESYIKNMKYRLNAHVLPYFGDRLVKEISGGTAQEYRIFRHQHPNPNPGLKRNKERRKEVGPFKPPSRSTLHQEIVLVRQILRVCERHGWITAVPNLAPPFRGSGKVSHRGWFSPAEYKSLYEATRARAKNPLNNRWRWECEQMHDYVLFMGNTGLRPDEAKRLEYRDVEVVVDRATDQTILEIEVRGKRGIGYCKSMPGAVKPFQRLQKRNKPEVTDRLFPRSQRELLNRILIELKLKTDRDGNTRSAYSLRHTYICFRLMEGADIYQVAKNCRTSVEMIQKFYASHIKNTLDAAAINVRKPSLRAAKSVKSNVA